jgi:hypothetical protein
MKNYKLVETEKNTSVVSLKTLKVLKTIPLTFKGNKQDFVVEWFSKLKFETRFKDTLKKIKKKEPYVFELIVNNKISGVRFVNLKESYRFELVYEDGVKIKIDELLFELYGNKLQEVFLNY